MPTKEELLAIMQSASGKKVISVNAEISAEKSSPVSTDPLSLLLEEAKITNSLLSELRRIFLGEGI